MGKVIIGTKGGDVLNGTSGDDWIFGRKGNDVLDGGAGSDHLFGGAGNDLLVYRAAQNVGAHDRYFGGSGCDTLRLDLTLAEWLRPELQSDIARFLRDSRHFEFQAFNLDVRGIEQLQVRVDGVALNPRDERVDAEKDRANVSEDGSVSGNVLANDSVPDLVRSVQLVSGPAHGALALGADGSFTYTPGEHFDFLGAGETATEKFTYRVIDADGDSDTAKVIITITGVDDAPANQAPVADDDSFSTAEDTAVSGNVLANDTDANGDALSAALVTGPAHGTLVLNANGSFSYTPGLNFNGADSFTYQVSDGALTDSATVSLTVSAVNDAPVAEADKEVIVPAGSGAVGLNIVQPTDVDGDALTVTIQAAPSNGTLAKADGALVGSGAMLTVAELTGLTFTATGAAGSASSLSYSVSDGNGGSDEATVSFSLVDAGSAGAVNVAVVYGDPLPIAGTDPLASIDGATRTAAQLNDDTHFDFDATILHVSSVNSAADLAGYDVVLSAGSAHDPMTPAYWAALQDYSEANQGGVITDGWFAFTLQTYLSGNADANYVSPIAATGFNFISTGGALAVTGGHPITEGVASIAVGGGPDAFWELADGLDSGATSLATTAGGDHGIAYKDTAGQGRTVYLGGIYSESETTYDTNYLRSGAADQVLEQAVNWAARGGATPLSLFGGAGNDVLVGGGGDDTLTGNGGNDSLTGGAGSDRFDYNAIGDGTDIVTDFVSGAGGDALDIRDVLVGFDPATPGNFIQLEEAGGSTTVRVNADGAGADFVALATLQGQTGLLLNDLLANGNLIVA